MASADFTVAEFLAWARTKPADEHYDFGSNCDCAIAQFLRETRRAENPSVIPGRWRDGFDGENHYYPYLFSLAASGVGYPQTFSGLARRLEVMAPHQSQLAALVPDEMCTVEFVERFHELMEEPERQVVSDTWTKPDAYLADIEQVSA